MVEQNKRWYYLDSMRAVLMMLGVVLHSSQVFNPSKSWGIYSEKSTELAYYLVHFIHLFRMPAFFVISGFFCAFTLKKYGVDYFVKVRFHRILIPLIATAVILNIPQSLILQSSGWRNITINTYITEGKWLSHLWFLINILAYFIIAVIATKLFKGLISRAKSLIAKVLKYIPIALLLIVLPLSAFVILSLNKIGIPLYSKILGFTSLFSILSYFPYFVFGMILSFQKEFLEKFASYPPALLMLYSLVVIALNNYFPDSSAGYMKYVGIYIRELSVWVSILVCFNLFFRFFNSHSKLWLFLSDASYTVYLFHHIIVIALGLLFIKMNIAGWLALPILISVTLFLTLGIHKYLILKSTTLRLLFNGRLQ